MLELDVFGLVTDPQYNVQRRAVMSDDGLGWTWQCNVFGHYILVCSFRIFSHCGNELTTLFLSRARVQIKCRALEAKLAASRTGPGRVLWMSSFAAHAHTFDADDWQLVNSTMPYEASKFQMDLIRAELSRRAGPSAQVRHYAVHPGAVDSSISAALDSGLLTYVKILTFYLVRFILFYFVPNMCPSRVSTEVGGFSCRLGGSAICTTTSLRGMALPLPFTSASLRLRLFRSCCLPLGCPLCRGRSRKRVRSLYACIL
jgi:hypothetical protein